MKKYNYIPNKDFADTVPTVPTPTLPFSCNLTDIECCPLSDEYIREYNRLKLLEGPDLDPEDNTLIVERIPCSSGGITKAARPSNPPQPAADGTPWTKEEEESLIAAYRDKVLISELAVQHQRTRGAITARLKKLGEFDRPLFRRPAPPKNWLRK